MNIKKCEVINYVIALIAMVIFIVDKFTLALFYLRLLFLVIADISFLAVSIVERAKDKYVVALDSITFCVLTLIHISLFLTGRYLDVPESILIMLVYIFTLFIFFILLLVGYLRRITHIASKNIKTYEINVTPVLEKNRFSNTEVEKEFVKKLKDNN